AGSAGFTGVSGTSGSDVWATNGRGLFHFDGGGWSTDPAQASSTLNAIDVHPNSGWAVGQSGALERFDGQRWTEYSASPPLGVTSIYAVDATTAFAASGARLLRYDGAKWSSLVASPAIYRSVSGTSATDVWAVGTDGALP